MSRFEEKLGLRVWSSSLPQLITRTRDVVDCRPAQGIVGSSGARSRRRSKGHRERPQKAPFRRPARNSEGYLRESAGVQRQGVMKIMRGAVRIVA